MILAEIVRGPRSGGTPGKRVPARRFIIVDGVPERYIDDEGTLRSVKGYAWGESQAELRRSARRISD